MGGSFSRNYTKIVLDAITKISTDISQKVQITYDSSQIIYITHTGGDVIIRGNKFIQRARVNMNALFKAMVTDSAQQNLALEIAQLAKAMTSGLNLGNFSDASNSINVLINLTIELMTTLSQTCKTLVEQQQTIWIEYTRGDVKIENNLFDQMADIWSKCVTDTVNNNKAIQDEILKLKQDSSATTDGLSAWAIAAVVAVILGVPTAGVVIAGDKALKYICPIMMIAGVVLLVLYFEWTEDTMVITGYSSFIENTPGCVPDPQHPPAVTQYGSAEAAGKQCMSDASCVAFDWKAYDVKPGGTYTYVKPEQTRFFKSVTSNCRDVIKNDDVGIMRSPTLYIFSGTPQEHGDIPGVVAGDIYINTQTATWYQLTTAWYVKEKITTKPYSKLTIADKAPTVKGDDGDAYIVYTTSDPVYFDYYTYKNSWNLEKRVPGPGYYASSPTEINGSGFKYTKKKTWMLYSGIAALVIGICGTAYAIFNASKKAPQKSEKST